VPGAIIIRDDRIRIDHILQKIIEVTAVGASQVRANFAAGIEQVMALLANTGKDSATSHSIARLGTASVKDSLVPFDFFSFVASAIAGDAPNFLNLLIQARISQIAKLAEDFGSQVLVRDAASANRSEQWFGKSQPAGERVQGIALLGAAKRIVKTENGP